MTPKLFFDVVIALLPPLGRRGTANPPIAGSCIRLSRSRAVGSFLKRYGKYAEDGQPLDAFVEVTLKDDDRNDPPITADALEMLDRSEG